MMADSIMTDQQRDDSGSDVSSPPPSTTDFDNMVAGVKMVTTGLRRVVKAQRKLPTQENFQDLLKRMEERFDDLNEKLDEHKRELNQKLDDHKAEIAVAVTASVSNSQIKVINLAIKARNERLTPIFSVRTGDRVHGTAITIDQLAALDADRAAALLRDAGLPDTGTAAELRSRLAEAMGVGVAL